jgi:anti-anti-sigma regulatory factor
MCEKIQRLGLKMASIKIEEKSNYKIMFLEGDFVGGEETDDLRNKLMANGKGDNNFLIVDLSKVVYLSSASLSVFISSDAYYKRYKGKMFYIVLMTISRKFLILLNFILQLLSAKMKMKQLRLLITKMNQKYNIIRYFAHVK